MTEARQSIRNYREETGCRTAVLDDDPTGSQSVHDVSVVTVIDAGEFDAALSSPGSTCFILTNTRSLEEKDAVQLNHEAATRLFDLECRLGARVEIVSRGDSTLRGHVIAEVLALDRARREVLGRGYDGVLLVPSYFEAGRFTADDVHWAMVDGQAVKVGDTEFAKDATFGYGASNLRDFVEEKSAGSITAGQVLSVSLDDIRSGGPRRIAEILSTASELQFIVINATDFADLETVVLGLHHAESAGKLFLHRSGPSFVRALAGIEPQDTLGLDDLWPNDIRPGHGLVVVGSHVGLSARQLALAQRLPGVTNIEMSAARLTGCSRGEHVAATIARVIDELPRADVVLFTSRDLLTGTDAADSLRIARVVSSAVVDVVRGAVAAHPAWVIAKGGITAHDVAVRGLRIRRARVLGQIFPGMVSVLTPVVAPDAVIGMPFVVFAGNVGDENSLAEAITLFRGPASL